MRNTKGSSTPAALCSLGKIREQYNIAVTLADRLKYIPTQRRVGLCQRDAEESAALKMKDDSKELHITSSIGSLRYVVIREIKHKIGSQRVLGSQKNSYTAYSYTAIRQCTDTTL